MTEAFKSGDYLTTEEAAQYRRISPRTLQNMRATGNGPIFRKHGKRVFYALADLIAWSEASKKESLYDDE